MSFIPPMNDKNLFTISKKGVHSADERQKPVDDLEKGRSSRR
jgi:hypothetical protein